MNPPVVDSRPVHPTFAAALLYWLKLGFISFGGPAGQIAVMHAELVARRRWISEGRFLHALNYCMVLPGPEAQQLATYIGWLLHGTVGGIAAGVLFILPGLILLVGLSAVYVAFGSVPWVEALFHGAKPVVTAVVIAAVIRIGSRTRRKPASALIAAGAFAGMLLHVPFALLVASAALLGWMFNLALAVRHGSKVNAESPAPAVIDDDHAEPTARTSARGPLIALLVGAALWAVPMAALVLLAGNDSPLTHMGWFFSRAAMVTFGGAYAVLPYVSRAATDVYGWLKPGQMIDGLALGETTPGPLILVTVFVGFVGAYQAGSGWAEAVGGAAVSAYFTFLPSFVFILVGAPLVERTRGGAASASALSGVTAAVTGVILHLGVHFAERVLWNADGSFDWFAAALASAALTAMVRFGVGVPAVVAAGSAAGLLRFAWAGG